MQSQSKVVKWALILGIVIVLNLFFTYALSLVYHSPDYQEFCKPNTSSVVEVIDEKKCTENGGQWTKNENPEVQIVVATPDGSSFGKNALPKGYCDQDFTCRQNFETAQNNYDKNVFVTLVVLGAIVLILSAFLKAGDVLSMSLAFGGVLSFVIASIRYWSHAGEVLKVVILGVALAALIWLAIKKFKNAG